MFSLKSIVKLFNKQQKLNYNKCDKRYLQMFTCKAAVRHPEVMAEQIRELKSLIQYVSGQEYHICYTAIMNGLEMPDDIISIAKNKKEKIEGK